MSLRASAAYVAVRVAAGALAMASLALIVRGLGPERYGQLTLGLAASAVVTLILFYPLNAMLARFYGEAALRAPLLALLRSGLLGIGVVLIALAGLAELLGLSPLAHGVLLAASGMALAQGLFDFSGQWLAAAQASWRYSLQFLGKALLTVLLAWLVLRGGGGAAAVLLAMALAFLLAALGSGGAALWHGLPGRHSLQLLPTVAGFAGPLMLTSLLAYLLLWGDRYLL